MSTMSGEERMIDGETVSSWSPMQMGIPEERMIDWETGWSAIQMGITKVKNLLEGVPEQQISAEYCMKLYTIVFDMCTQSRMHVYRQQLYDSYKGSLEEYMTTTVLPALRQEHEDSLLRELVKRWANHKLMVRWLFKFFEYLDRSFLKRRALPSLEDVALMCFRDQVYEKVKNDVKDAMITLIHRDRENERIDRSLVRNVVGFLVEIGWGTLDVYEVDFEPAILNDAAAYYARKRVPLWARESSPAEYEVKVKVCLESEGERVGHYLHADSKDKLLQRVHNAMFCECDHPFSENEFGSHSTSPDDKVLNTADSSTPSVHSEPSVMDFEARWTSVQTGITKLKNLVEGVPEQQFTSEECMKLYTTIYEICLQPSRHNYTEQLYDRYKETLEEYMIATVLPALKQEQDEFMLREFVKRWENHKVMVRWLLRFFERLDRRRPEWMPSLHEVALRCFQDRVFAEIRDNVEKAVMNLIDRGPELEEVDRALLRSVRTAFEEIGIGGMGASESDCKLARLIDMAAAV